jgi:hypothetical protein
MKYLIFTILCILFSCTPPKQTTQQPDTLAPVVQSDTTVSESVTEEDESLGYTPQDQPQQDEYSENIPADLVPFVPDGYSILNNTEGDLNSDLLKDKILVLKKNGEDTIRSYEPARPLLILVGEGDSKYRLAARNDSTVFCYQCGGVMGDPFTGITIKNGYFSVEHYGGSSWRWTRIITYKYSKEENKWFLNRDGSESFHASDPEKVESTIKTAKDFGKVEFGDFNINK